MAASYTPADKRTPLQIEKLALSDSLIKEIMDADVIILSVAVYNFNLPGSLKAWIDLASELNLCGSAFQT